MVVREIYPEEGDSYRRGTQARRGGQGVTSGPNTAPNILSVLWRGKFAFLATLVLCLGCGLLYLAVMPARYLSSSSLLIDPRLGKGIGADPAQPGFVADGSAIDSQVKLLTSQTVLERVATLTDLSESPEFNGSQRSLLQTILNPSPVLSGRVDLKALEDAITIKRPERTYVVQVDVLARDPAKAAAIANAVTQAYTADQVSARLDAAAGDSKFVDQRMQSLQSEIKDAETKVEAYKTKNNVVTATGLRSNEQQITDLTKVLGEARAKTSDAKARRDEIDRMARSGRLDSSSDALKSLTIERLRQQQTEAERETAKIAKTLGDLHPAVQEARSQVTKVDSLIKSELQRLKASVGGDYQVARHNETQIVGEVDRLKSQSTKISATLVPLTQLERQVDALRASYDRFAKVKDNVSQQEADSPPARVIAVARPAVSTSSPKKSLVALVSAAAGMFFGLAAALFQGGAKQPQRAAVPDHVDDPEPFVSRPRHQRRYWDDGDDGHA